MTSDPIHTVEGWGRCVRRVQGEAEATLRAARRAAKLRLDRKPASAWAVTSPCKFCIASFPMGERQVLGMTWAKETERDFNSSCLLSKLLQAGGTGPRMKPKAQNAIWVYHVCDWELVSAASQGMP